MELKCRLQELRERDGLSINDMMIKSGVKASSFLTTLKTGRVFRLDSMIRFCAFFGIGLKDFLYYETSDGKEIVLTDEIWFGKKRGAGADKHQGEVPQETPPLQPAAVQSAASVPQVSQQQGA